MYYNINRKVVRDNNIYTVVLDDYELNYKRDYFQLFY